MNTLSFREIPMSALSFNPFSKVLQQWMLISAGTEKDCNTMTASWGMFGGLWQKNVVEVFIRPQRFTKTFIDSHDFVTLSFLPDRYRDALKICGTVSGRDTDKWKKAGISPFPISGTVAVAEAELVIVGQKLYSQYIDPKLFVDKNIDAFCYPDKDYHEAYIYEVKQVFEKER